MEVVGESMRMIIVSLVMIRFSVNCATVRPSRSSGICETSSTYSKGFCASDDSAKSSVASCTVSTSTGSICQWRSIWERMRREVMLASTSSTRRLERMAVCCF